MHYLNKQAGWRGRLAVACTPSLTPSLFLYNKCVSRLSLHFLVSSLCYIYNYLFLFFTSSLVSSLSHTRARSRNVTVTNNYPFHAVVKAGKSDRQGGAGSGRRPLHLVMNFKLARIHNAAPLTVRMNRRWQSKTAELIFPGACAANYSLTTTKDENDEDDSRQGRVPYTDRTAR